jgi:hypothetical protein
MSKAIVLGSGEDTVYVVVTKEGLRDKRLLQAGILVVASRSSLQVSVCDTLIDAAWPRMHFGSHLERKLWVDCKSRQRSDCVASMSRVQHLLAAARKS